MFSILNDTVYYKGEAVASIHDDVRATLRGEVEEALELVEEWDALVEAHEEELNERYRKGYQEAVDKYENEYERGYDRALDDMKRFSEAS